MVGEKRKIGERYAKYLFLIPLSTQEKETLPSVRRPSSSPPPLLELVANVRGSAVENQESRSLPKT